MLHHIILKTLATVLRLMIICLVLLQVISVALITTVTTSSIIAHINVLNDHTSGHDQSGVDYKQLEPAVTVCADDL